MSISIDNTEFTFMFFQDYFDKGEYIIREGEEGSTFFIIAKGEVRYLYFFPHEYALLMFFPYKRSQNYASGFQTDCRKLISNDWYLICLLK